MTLQLERGGRPETAAVTPTFSADRSRWQMGVAVELADARTESRSMPLWEAVPASFVGVWELLVLLKQTIGGMISQGAAPDLAGPIGIAQLTGEVSREGGIIGWLTIGILLSINLAVFNILPLPHAGRRPNSVRSNRMAAPAAKEYPRKKRASYT